MKCPMCSGIDTGKVGAGQYYCWRCLVEFNMTGPRGYTAYYVDEEGLLLALEAPDAQGVPAENGLR